MTTQRWTLSLLAAGLLLGTLAAQSDQATLPTHWRKLGLSKDQESQVLKIRGQYDVKIATLEQQLKALRQQEQADLDKVLTDTQRAKLKELREPPKDDKGKEKEKDKK